MIKRNDGTRETRPTGDEIETDVIEDDRVESIVGHYVDRLTAGEPFDPSEIRKHHPDEASKVIRALQVMGRLKNEARDGRVGTTFAGDFELLAVIGSGGMGVVYKARQVSSDRTVAVKVMKRTDDEDAVTRHARFRREAETLRELDHPGVVQVHEIGEDNDTPFLVMEYVHGTNLKDLLQRGVFDPEDAARAIRDAANAVEAAHRADILHRDIKPANLILDAGSGRVRLTDFGIAKRLDDESRITATGYAVGTPSYMSPEQARGGGILGRESDVYSLGATLYALLTGQAPFLGADAVLHSEVRPPRKIRGEIPRDLGTICLECLEKDAAARHYRTARELAADLEKFIAGKPIGVRPPGPAEITWKWCRRRPLVAGLIGALVVMFLVGFVLVSREWRRAEHHRGVAEKRLERTWDVVRGLVIDKNRGSLLANLEPHELHRRLLDRLVDFHLALLLEEYDAKKQRDLVTANRELAELAREGGEYERANEVYRRTAQHQTLAMLLFPENVVYWREVITTQRMRSECLVESGDAASAAGVLREAIDVQERLLEWIGDEERRVEIARLAELRKELLGLCKTHGLPEPLPKTSRARGDQEPKTATQAARAIVEHWNASEPRDAKGRRDVPTVFVTAYSDGDVSITDDGSFMSLSLTSSTTSSDNGGFQSKSKSVRYEARTEAGDSIVSATGTTQGEADTISLQIDVENSRAIELDTLGLERVKVVVDGTRLELPVRLVPGKHRIGLLGEPDGKLERPVERMDPAIVGKGLGPLRRAAEKFEEVFEDVLVPAIEE